jgi:protein disulfide-isomerase A6|eukprot:COSAG01_NODE_2832_length_6997_cov_44.218904_2_plen_139_part_00
MKPAWDKLMEEFDSSSSVVVGDVDCTVETELCSDYGVSGYPTIKYFTPETDEKGDSYNGGRDFDALKAHVVDKLEVKCDVAAPDGCTDKEKKYIEKMKAKGDDAVAAQKTRLDGMKSGKMAKEQKAWLMQRLNILNQM